MKRFLILFFVLISISTAIPAKALPYVSYNYDNFGDAVPSQAGYIPEKTVSYGFSKPEDIYYYGENFYIADTGNNSIAVLSKDLDSVVKVYDRFTMPDGSETTLSQPEGVFVSEEYIYIADTGNNRILVADFDSAVATEIEKPVSEIYDQKKTFQPTKVLADKAGNIYTVLGNMTTGAMFSRQGEFMGFYGANRSEVNAMTIRNHFVSEKKKSRRKRNIPTGISSFDIDGDFVYTCTADSEKTADIIKKLNAAGKNIFADREMHFGDYHPKHNTVYSKTQICDIDISENGNINCLDAETGHIFQYDKDCRLLFIMGNISGQSGGFESPSAIETVGNNIYVLDSGKNNITVFTETDFGKTVHEAVGLYNAGYYTEALDLWYEVLKYDGNYSYAYNGVGYALLRNSDYKSSMKYARLADNTELYNKAFEEYRREFLKTHAGKIFFVIIIIIFLLIKKKRRKFSDSRRRWLKYTVMHPFEGFENMRWKKSGSLKTAFIIIVLFFFGVIARDRLYGLQFAEQYDRTFNIIPYVIESIVLFAAWTVGNWSICTLLDGEGTIKNICIYSAYALVPYVVQIYINVILSHLLVRDEYVFMQVIEVVGTVWSIIMIFSAVKAVHQYSVKKTFTAILLTVAAMLIMLLLLILFMVLLQQIWIFISAVCTEIIYRLRV